MISLEDATLDSLRQRVFAAVHKLDTEGDAGDREVWIEWINDPDSAATTSLLEYVRDTPFELEILRALAAIGAAVADDFLLRLPIPVAMISDSRWQRKRELAGVIEKLSAMHLQQLIWRAQALADGGTHKPSRADIDRRMPVLRLLIFALEAGGITGTEQADFALSQGLPETFFVDASESGCRDVPLDQLAALYDVAAAKVGWRPFREIMARYVDEARGRV